MWWARVGNPARAGRGGCVLGSAGDARALAIVFLAIQLVEYGGQHFTPRTDAYGSLFYTITGFHGAHVAVGLLMILVISVRAWLGHFSRAAAPRGHERHLVLALRGRGVARGVHVAIPLPAFSLTA